MKFAKIFGAAFIAISAFSLAFVPGSFDNNYGNALFYSTVSNAVVVDSNHVVNN